METDFTKLAMSVSKDLKIKGIANSLRRSRDGIKLNVDAAKELVGESVPLLQNHDWNSLPSGKATITKIDDQGMEFEGKLYQSAPNLESIKDNIANGTLSVSVGFLRGGENDAHESTDIDLLELSLTPTPSDQGASVCFQSLNKDDIHNDFYKKEVDPMDKDTKKKVTLAAGDPANSTDTGSDGSSDSSDSSSDSEPTIQDVLDALTALSKAVASLATDVAAIKKATVKDDSDSSDSSSDDSGSDSSDPATDATQALKDEALNIVKEGMNGQSYAKLYRLFRN